MNTVTKPGSGGQGSEHEILKYLTPREALSTLWKKGLKGKELLEQHSSLMDSFIRQRFLDVQGQDHGAALVALGGYGRRELFPFSDVDLLLLYHPDASYRLEQISDAVFYPLWDAGLEVGHGVRTVEQCIHDIEKDFFFLVSLIDARFLCGDHALFQELNGRLADFFSHGARSRFARDMMAHREERHSRFGDHTYLLEPNIKESRGGLRDLQAMEWTGKVLFGLKSLNEFESSGMLTSREYEGLQDAKDHLFVVRNRLHYASNRHNDRLFFEYQEEIAKALHLYDSSGLMGVERFMKGVHQSLKTISIASDIFFEHVNEVISRTEGRGSQVQELSSGLVEVQLGDRKFLGLRDRDLAIQRPWMVFRLFAEAAKQDIPVHFGTRRQIAEIAQELKERWISSRRCYRYFLEVLECSRSIQVLEQMLDCGVLTAFLPEMEHLHHLALHDIYHVYTVDMHLINTLVQLNILMDEMKDVSMGVDVPAVLRLSALLHDVAKGTGGGHAEKGAEVVKGVGERFGFTEAEIDCLSFLVRYHLHMMDLATRRDLEDEGLIIRFARTVRSMDKLNMLYLLSIADARATGPNAWNQWKGALLQELYLKTAHLLEQPEMIDPDREAAVRWMRQKVADRLGEEAEAILSVLPEDYLLSFSPDAVLEHLECVEQLPSQQVVCRPEEKGESWSVLIVTKDRTGLLSKICGVFALYGLNILQANIFTLKNGIAVDMLDVSPMQELSFSDIDWERLCADLRLAVTDRLGLSHRLAARFRSIGVQGSKPLSVKRPRVVIDNSTSSFFTIIEIYAPDSPCLLYSVTKTLADFGINIYKAKIGSSGDQAVDVFYVLDHLGQRIDDPEIEQELEQALLYASEICLI